MWAGAKVHDCIKHTLTNLQRGISVLDVDQIIDITLNQMREEFRSSREKRYLTHPKTCALFEHEYEVSISDVDWKKTADKVEQCLRNFYASETFRMLKEIPQQMWLEVENFSSFNLNNSKIWAVLDCSFRTEDGGVTIIDWKTGRSMSDDVSMQLSCYAMYAMEKWGVNARRRLMATGRSTKLVGQAGEYLVAAELSRRGLIATTFTGNVPHYDIIASLVGE